jgi:hypothetical protein
VFKQSFSVGSDIYNALAQHPNVEFIKTEKQSNSNYEQLVNKNGAFLQLFFRFTDHSHKVSDGETLRESMLFCVDDRETGITIFEKTIEFSETYFMNIIRKEGNEDKRQYWLLKISEELMKPLK